jgi:predicted GH43/DUF377 family glycosyl hydrolase
MIFCKTGSLALLLSTMFVPLALMPQAASADDAPVQASASAPLESWEIGPFVKQDSVNPIFSPNTKGVFVDPMTGQTDYWEQDNVFNPAATVRDNKVCVLFRAEDDSGQGVGGHTSRVGLAESSDGLHFTSRTTPVLYPDVDAQKKYDWPGGDEDPRVVETSDHGYIVCYTSWNRQVPRLCIATSKDLIHWDKQGPAFAAADGGKFLDMGCKSGSIVTKQQGDHLVATKLNGKYWMIWGEGTIHAATSDDLINWSPVVDAAGDIVPILPPRPGHFDSRLAEAGPPALLTKNGIVLFYNGKGDNGAYSGGQALLDAKDPTHVLDRPDSYFITPERPYEKNGQYTAGTVFIEGLVRFHKHWFLYYGTADSHVAVAESTN